MNNNALDIVRGIVLWSRGYVNVTVRIVAVDE